MSEEIEEQKFGIYIVRRINKKTKQMQVELKTKGEKFPLSDAVIILEGWIERVKQEIKKPFNFEKMIFKSFDKQEEDQK
ncbi:MAG: hypothetical protein QW451_00050 [Candidatus Aenigmatarchaeota archaeon]